MSQQPENPMQEFEMISSVLVRVRRACLAWACCNLIAAGGGAQAAVAVNVVGPNAVSHWNEVASTTINQPAAATGTPEERLPIYAVDLATVHLAIYDAVMAIEGTHQPYAVRPTAPVAGASTAAAVGAAAYGVLKGLFPSRGAAYEAAYSQFVASLPEDGARRLGLAVGAEVAAGMLALRANDGRAVALAPYVPGTGPGQFRGVAPINRAHPHVKPFVLNSNAQFRVPAPPALTSAAYAADVNETRSLGAGTSNTRTMRTADQEVIARFNTEAPPLFWTRNLRRFIMTAGTLAEHARLSALLWVAHADASIACFESKYHYNTWRPTSAITLADSAGNPAVVADPTWAPVVPTPNHPEYPAAHSCIAGTVAGVLRRYHGTPEVVFVLDSSVTGTGRHYGSVQAMVDEIALARLTGGMHFRFATTAGATLGEQVAAWTMANAFARR
ncbi:vanadium-dependent haloperoxidase [Pseudorhodoferax sp.]|uniref:vanadium-dependent haloperoxidase n=1 Tax=Pseudorhodoferax sp. TaxID=1993553 RepID=UPI002DD64045|nr:vanadium-dependent haloperoxidase [Pseudorhodoferax sp.]